MEEYSGIGELCIVLAPQYTNVCPGGGEKRDSEVAMCTCSPIPTVITFTQNFLVPPLFPVVFCTEYLYLKGFK
jgi:hypothetical protein